MLASQFARAAAQPFRSLLTEARLPGGFVTSKQLAFNMQAQTQSNWCWAATSASVSKFFSPASTWTQCLIANAELGQTGCCGSPVPAACNVPWYLDRALSRTANFDHISAVESFANVCAQIDAGKPLGARIGWTGGGGHFMVIYGYSTISGNQFFDIDDPIYGKSHLSVSDFSSHYQGAGSWTHSYYTKSAVLMPIRLPHVPDAVLRQIHEARPLLELKQNLSSLRDLQTSPLGAAGSESQPSVGMAHDVYVQPLDALLSGGPVNAQPVSLRVYETSQGLPTAFYDLSRDAQPRIVQMSASSHYLHPFALALESALSATRNDSTPGELRLYRVPALNFEGLWIKYDSDDADQVIPLRQVGTLVPNQPVTMKAAQEALRKAAAPLANMDETMGA